MMNFTITEQIISVNDNSFEALSEDTQKILTSTAKAWQGKFRQAIDATASVAAQKLEAEGMSQVTPSSADFETARSATRVMWEEWAKANGEVGEKLLADEIGRAHV